MIRTRARNLVVSAASIAAFWATACSNQQNREAIQPGPGTATSADGVPIAYEVHGQGPTTLVFVHGWSCDRAYWRHQIRPFSTEHRVVTLDLAGHGASGTGRKVWSIPNFANDVAAVVRALDLKNVVLIGHSLGGPVVVEAGMLLPDRVTGVVGVDAFFDEWSDPGLTKFVDQLRTNFAAQTRAFVRKELFLPTSPAAFADSISDAMAAAPPEIALPAMDSLLGWSRDRQDIAVSALQAPIGLIVVAGGRTATTRFQRSRGAKPALGVDEVPGAGHFLMLEAPEKFNAQLGAMLSRIPPHR
jgi:pimeloyl-ACP methyl ester carboxylesterase